MAWILSAAVVTETTLIPAGAVVTLVVHDGLVPVAQQLNTLLQAAPLPLFLALHGHLDGLRAEESVNLRSAVRVARRHRDGQTGQAISGRPL